MAIKLTVAFFFFVTVSFFILAETNWFISTETNWLVAGKTNDLSGKTINFIQDNARNAAFTVQSIISQFKYFLPAALIKNQTPEEIIFSSDDEFEELVEEDAGLAEDRKEDGGGPEAILGEIQENIDDISEKIDVVAWEINEIIGEKTKENEVFQENELETEEPQKDEEESDKIEDIEDTEKLDVAEETMPAKKEAVLCQKNNEPDRNKVIFNEIAWMGSQNSANDEWLELKNISGTEIDLSGWQILDKDQQIKIFFNDGNRLSASGLFLLERTNDDSVLGVIADFIYSGALGNNGEILYLFDEKCRLQDEIIANPDWPAGDNDMKRTMERKSDFGWQTSFASGGTPKNPNSSGYFAIPTSGAGGGAPPPAPAPQASYPKILISEVQVAGVNSEKEDFVELYNPNTESVDLTNWYLQRKTENANDFSSYAPKNLFSGKIMGANDYFLVANASSSFLAEAFAIYPLTENNALAFKNPDGEIVDKVGWGGAPDFETATTANPQADKSIGRKWSTATESYIDTDNNYEDFEIQTPTPKAQNQSPQPENQLPIAQFIFTPEAPTINQEIVFDASSSTDADGIIASYVWDFGDENSTAANLATTSHFFSTSGEFLTTFWVEDDVGATSSPATTTIIVTSQPILEISTSTLIFRAEEAESNLSSQNLIIENSGDGELDWTVSIIYDSILTDWLLTDRATGTVPSYSSSTLEISVDIFGLATGTYQATATVEAAGAENSPKEISISLTVFQKTIKTVIINEIAWMGTGAANPSDEWIELYNNTNSDIDLNGWTLVAADGTPDISFSTSTIFGQGYFLLERTANTTISDIEEDQIYTGNLNNGGEKLELRDADNNLIDLVDCSFGWFSGTTTSYSSMERIDPSAYGSYSDNWANNNGIIKNGSDAGGNPINGTPKSKNSVSL